MANKFKFTKSAIDDLPIPEAGKRVEYQDTEIKSLRLRVSAGGSKTFSVLRRIEQKLERVAICKAWEIPTMEKVRSRAAEISADIAIGKNPAEVKRARRAEMTLGELFDEYITRHCEAKGKKTTPALKENFRRYLGHWHNSKLSSIRKTEVGKHHAKLGKDIGAHTANRTLELLRAVFNKGIYWELFAGVNPAVGIEKFTLKSRDRFIYSDELPRFFQAVAEEPNHSMRDYFLLSLLTGARQANVLAMRWDDVSFARAEWRIDETKNGDPQTVTLSAEALKILKNRKPKEPAEWVFPSQHSSASGHIQNPKKAWKNLLERAGLSNLRLHDLRRTLGSWQAKSGASLAIIGKSLNHKNAATTAIYARLDLDPVRDSVNTATSAIMAAAGLNSGADVLAFKKKA